MHDHGPRRVVWTRIVLPPRHEPGAPRLQSLDYIIHHWLNFGRRNLANAQRQTEILARKGGHLATQDTMCQLHLLRGATDRV
jgi:hypothetical protein